MGSATIGRTTQTRAVIPFANGDCMDQKTFHMLYEQTPPRFKAELIMGVVHIPSPTTSRHGRPHARLVHWLSLYMDETPGTDVVDNTTNILDDESEPQPDACLLIDPECGGQTTEQDDFIVGSCELVAEVSLSSITIDLNAKKRMYEQADVREYLVAKIAEETVVWFVRGKKGFEELEPDNDGIHRSPTFPGLWLDPVTLFQKSPRRMNAVLQQGLATPEHAAFVAKLEAARTKRKPKTNGKKRGAK